MGYDPALPLRIWTPAEGEQAASKEDFFLDCGSSCRSAPRWPRPSEQAVLPWGRPPIPVRRRPASAPSRWPGRRSRTRWRRRAGRRPTPASGGTSSRPLCRSTCMYRPVCRTSPMSSRLPGLSTRDLAHCRVPLRCVVDVVQDPFRDDHVERAVGEGEPAGVAVFDLDVVGPPSSWAFSCVASGWLPDRSAACQMSTPTAFPVVRRLAAPIRSRPRPQPTSSTASSPRKARKSRSRSRPAVLGDLAAPDQQAGAEKAADGGAGGHPRQRPPAEGERDGEQHQGGPAADGEVADNSRRVFCRSRGVSLLVGTRSWDLSRRRPPVSRDVATTGSLDRQRRRPPPAIPSCRCGVPQPGAVSRRLRVLPS